MGRGDRLVKSWEAGNKRELFSEEIYPSRSDWLKCLVRTSSKHVYIFAL